MEVRAEISDRQFQDLYALWDMWAREEGASLNNEIWAKHFLGLVLHGAVVPLIATIDGEPVGCGDVTFFDDPFTGQRTSCGDHVYVVPGARKQGALEAILMTGACFTVWLGAKRGILPASDFLKDFYLSKDSTLKPMATILEWEVNEEICHQ